MSDTSAGVVSVSTTDGANDSAACNKPRLFETKQSGFFSSFI